MNSENNIIGLRIRKIREYQGLSRERLAEKANISTQFLADIETGKKGMSAVTLKKLCTALNSSADTIIFGRENTDCSEINSMLSTIPKEKKENIEQLLRIIIDII